MTYFQVRAALSDTDRALLARVRPALTIGFRDMPYEARSDEDKQLRAVSALVDAAGLTYEDGDFRGEYHGPNVFDRAIAAMRRQVEACEREANVEHWTDQLTPGAEAQAYHMADVLVEARQGQLREACEALAALEEAKEDMDTQQARIQHADAV